MKTNCLPFENNREAGPLVKRPLTGINLAAKRVVPTDGVGSARDPGYSKETSMRITELPASNLNMEAFSNHSVDISTLTLDDTLTLRSKGQKLRVGPSPLAEAKG